VAKLILNLIVILPSIKKFLGMPNDAPTIKAPVCFTDSKRVAANCTSPIALLTPSFIFCLVLGLRIVESSVSFSDPVSFALPSTSFMQKQQQHE